MGCSISYLALTFSFNVQQQLSCLSGQIEVMVCKTGYGFFKDMIQVLLYVVNYCAHYVIHCSSKGKTSGTRSG